MGRRSIYEFEAKGTVSIWVAIVPRSRIPADYFEEHYGREDDGPFSRFAEDFGFGYYDHDFVDMNGVAGRAKPVGELLGPCSFSASYLADAVAAAERQGLDKTAFVFVLHNIAYRPEPLVADGLFHPIDLRVKGRKDIIVHARKGYYAPTGK